MLGHMEKQELEIEMKWKLELEMEQKWKRNLLAAAPRKISVLLALVPRHPRALLASSFRSLALLA